MTYRIVAEFRVKDRKVFLEKNAFLNRVSGLQFISISYGAKHDDSWREKVSEKFPKRTP